MKFNVNWVILILFLGVITLFIVTDFYNSPSDSREIGSFIVILLLLYFAFGYSPEDKKKKAIKAKQAMRKEIPEKEEKQPREGVPGAYFSKSRFKSDLDESDG